MPVIQNDVQNCAPQAIVPDAASQATRAVRLLSPQEIKSVAGGPEGSVGTGLGPP
jgi:hypothetical protein